jgi:hypothetical protein
LKFDGWIPIRFYWRQGQPGLDWCLMGDTGFTEPFFEMSVQRRLSHPFHHAFRRQTSVETLREWYAESPGVPPTGFIFHLSRCGSTLLSQMLAAPDRNIVLSEAPPLDAVLRAHFRNPSLSPAKRVEWFRYMVSALGQRRGGKQEHLFIKFDTWTLAELPVIRQAFPDVPWVFLYRDPIEVLASQLHQRAAWTFPGLMPPPVLGLGAELAEIPHQEYCARALARICELALQHHVQGGGWLVNYTELPAAVGSILADYWGIRYSEEEVRRMREVARDGSKTPGVPGEVRALSARWIDPFYRRLEQIRALQSMGRSASVPAV